jgi:hypothetical protein
MKYHISTKTAPFPLGIGASASSTNGNGGHISVAMSRSQLVEVWVVVRALYKVARGRRT